MKRRSLERGGGVTGIDALILAGSRGATDSIAALTGVSHKALAPIAGKPMLAYVLSAVHAVPSVQRVFICIDAATDIAEAAGDLPFTRVAPASSPAASLAAALAAIDGSRPLLVTTADHPLLTAAMIGHFLDHAPPDADLSVGLAEAETVAARFPGGKRTFYRLAGKGYSGCNLFLARRPGAIRVAEYWRRMEAHRKRPLRLAREIGVFTLLRLVLGRLDLDAAFRHVSRLTGARIRPVVLPFGEAATDVDKPEDYELVSAVLKQRQAEPATHPLAPTARGCG
jgi:CTP:molybdopterin cytidylyltransferase MocA